MAAVEPPNRVRPSIEIDEALREGWFEFWYQPKINLKRKYLAGAEAIAHRPQATVHDENGAVDVLFSHHGGASRLGR